jgi:hypothetical protein
MSETDRLMTREIAAFTTMMKTVCLLVMTAPLSNPWTKGSYKVLHVASVPLAHIIPTFLTFGNAALLGHNSLFPLVSTIG